MREETLGLARSVSGVGRDTAKSLTLKAHVRFDGTAVRNVGSLGSNSVISSCQISTGTPPTADDIRVSDVIFYSGSMEIRSCRQASESALQRLQGSDACCRAPPRKQELRAQGWWAAPRKQKWCPGAESNHRHCDFQSHALPTELPGLCRSGHLERAESSRLIGGRARPVQAHRAFLSPRLRRLLDPALPRRLRRRPRCAGAPARHPHACPRWHSAPSSSGQNRCCGTGANRTAVWHAPQGHHRWGTSTVLALNSS